MLYATFKTQERGDLLHTLFPVAEDPEDPDAGLIAELAEQLADHPEVRMLRNRDDLLFFFVHVINSCVYYSIDEMIRLETKSARTERAPAQRLQFLPLTGIVRLSIKYISSFERNRQKAFIYRLSGVFSV